MCSCRPTCEDQIKIIFNKMLQQIFSQSFTIYTKPSVDIKSGITWLPRVKWWTILVPIQMKLDSVFSLFIKTPWNKYVQWQFPQNAFHSDLVWKLFPACHNRDQRHFDLTHWCLDNMVTILQTTFWNAFPRMEILVWLIQISMMSVPKGPTDNK